MDIAAGKQYAQSMLFRLPLISAYYQYDMERPVDRVDKINTMPVKAELYIFKLIFRVN